MSVLVEEFYAAVRQRCTALAQKHREERRLVKRPREKRDTRKPGPRDGSALKIEDVNGSEHGR